MTLRPCVWCSPTSCSTYSTASSASSDGGESRSGPSTPRALLVVALFLRQAHKRRPPLLLVVVRCVRHLPLSTKCVGAPRPRRSERADGTEKVGVLKEERLATERTERAGERGAGERVGGDKAPEKKTRVSGRLRLRLRLRPPPSSSSASSASSGAGACGDSWALARTALACTTMSRSAHVTSASDGGQTHDEPNGAPRTASG